MPSEKGGFLLSGAEKGLNTSQNVTAPKLKMEEFGSDLAIALIAVLAAKALDELIELIKKKNPKD